jgi:hypothetical protein
MFGQFSRRLKATRAGRRFRARFERHHPTMLFVRSSRVARLQIARAPGLDRLHELVAVHFAVGQATHRIALGVFIAIWYRAMVDTNVCPQRRELRWSRPKRFLSCSAMMHVRRLSGS